MHCSGYPDWDRYSMKYSDCGISICQIQLLGIQYTCQQTERTLNFWFSEKEIKQLWAISKTSWRWFRLPFFDYLQWLLCETTRPIRTKNPQLCCLQIQIWQSALSDFCFSHVQPNQWMTRRHKRGADRKDPHFCSRQILQHFHQACYTIRYLQ